MILTNIRRTTHLYRPHTIRQSIKQEQSSLPVFDDIFLGLSNTRCSTKIDLASIFCRLQLDEPLIFGVLWSLPFEATVVGLGIPSEIYVSHDILIFGMNIWDNK